MAAAYVGGGYDARFVEPVDKDLECPVCLLALRDPLQTSCGHLMCRTCMDRITKRSRFQCPLDNKFCSRDEAFPDTYNGRRVLSLKVKCSNRLEGCSWLGELRDLEKHCCEISQCVFKSVGCTQKMDEMDAEEHEDESVKEHLRLLLTAVMTQNEKLNDQVRQLTRQVEGLQVAVATLERNGTHNHQQPDTFTVQWRIENWSEILGVAKSEKARSYQLLSRPYYISHPGYRVCIQAFPNGTQGGRGNHLSIFLKLMKGRYDGDLPWPFQLKYSISVVDQQEGGSNVLKRINPLIEDDETPFQRPRVDRNPGRGWAQFISHVDLQTRHYIKDNVVLVLLDINLT